MPTPPPTRTRVVRRIAADATGTALLLAGREALELWPGVRRVGAAGHRALVETDVPCGGGRTVTTAAAVRASPPRRAATAYVSRFAWSGPGLPSTEGTLTLAPGADPAGSTLAVLVLLTDPTDGRPDELRLRREATGFLRNLAAAAEARSRAA